MNNQGGEYEQGQNPQQNSIKAFFVTNVLVYFTYNPKVHQTLNYSRIYNSYINILEIIQLLIVNIQFIQTQKNFTVIFFTVVIIATFLINLICRIGNKHNYFLAMIFLNFIINLINIGPALILKSDYDLVNLICTTISDFHVEQNQDNFESKELCQRLYILYYSWFATIFFYSILRIISIYLGYKAYKFLSEKHNEEETKKRRKLRYIQMYKIKEQKKIDIDKPLDRKI